MPFANPSRLVLTVSVTVALACAPSHTPETAPPGSTPPAPPTAELCQLFGRTADPPDEISVALLDAVDPNHAPWPQNDGERLLFRHLFETLLRVDCQGAVYGGLAESWVSKQSGRLWIFTLREGARFWDGVQVTAEHVVASWTSGAAERLAFAAGIDSVKAEGPRKLAVYLDRAYPTVPRIFADPEFAIARRLEPQSWPQGSMPGRLEQGEFGEDSQNRRFRLLAPARDAATLLFLQFPEADPRDVLRGGYDVLVTDDQSAIDYAAPQPADTALPLPWDRSYVLLSTTRVRALRSGGEPGTLAADFLAALARDAVRGDARGHRAPAWWQELESCGELFPQPSGLPRVPPGAYRAAGPRRVVYADGDVVARGLATRIVALSSEGAAASPETATLAAAVPGLIAEPGALLAMALVESEFDASLRYGDEFAYVVPLPRIVLDPCFAARKLASRIEWLAPQQFELSATLLPLVDTRRHVIAATGRVGLSIDWDGTVVVSTTPAPGARRQ